MPHESRSRTETKELDFSEDTKRFLRELFGESIGSPSASKKLDAIIAMLMPLGSVPSTLGLIESRLEIIHGLVSEIRNLLPRPPGPPAKVDSVKFVFPGLKENE
jgi:hypothetical protein